MNLKSVGVGIAIALGALGGTAWAAGTIASIVAPDGTIHGCYLEKRGTLRVVPEGQACAKGEAAIRWNQQGPKGDTGPAGPQGPQGEPGPALASLAGVPCDTGSPDAPDGRTQVAVDAGTGAMTLTCTSSSTNPVLTLGLLAGPQVCVTNLGITVCTLSRFAVREIDAGGDPVVDGFACSAPPSLSPFPVTCQTQRFGPGTAVRLEAVGAPGFTPSWTGCDSVTNGVCTVTLNGGRVVAVTPTEAT